MNFLEQGLSLFENGQYDEAVYYLIQAYEEGQNSEAVINFLQDCFVKPNTNEFLRNYSTCYGIKDIPEFKDLSLHFIPVGDDKYYIFDINQKTFVASMELPDIRLECNYQQQGEILITKVDSFDVFIELFQNRTYQKYYIILEDFWNTFFSFFQVFGDGEQFLNYLIPFHDVREMVQYFLANEDVGLPQFFYGTQIEPCQRIISLIEHIRHFQMPQNIMELSSCNVNKKYFTEIRGDFEVSGFMKRAWDAELEVLRLVDKICTENNITYYAEGGTLLGSIRHKGFIPWDDDIDIMMLKEDYDRFVSIIQKQYRDKYEIMGFVNPDTAVSEEMTNIYFSSFGPNLSKWDYSEYLQTFHGFPFGVGIDILPLFYVPREEELFITQREVVKYILFTMHHFNELKEKNELEERLVKIEELLNLSIQREGNVERQLYRCLYQTLNFVEREESDKAILFFFLLEDTKKCFSLQWLEETTRSKFLDTDLSIPKGYHEVLTTEFGDYMVPKKISAIHGYPFYKSDKAELDSRINKFPEFFEVDTFYDNIETNMYYLMLCEAIKQVE